MRKHSAPNSYTLLTPAHSPNDGPEAPYPMKDPPPADQDLRHAAISRRPSYDSADRTYVEALLVAPVAELAKVPFMSARGIADRNQERSRVLSSWQSAPFHRSSQRRGRRPWDDTAIGGDNAADVGKINYEA